MAEESVQSKVEEMLLGPEPTEAEPDEAALEAAQEPIEETEGDTPAEEEEAVEAASDDESASEEESPEELGLVEVEYDGITYEVPETLKDALLRQSDYTAKTTEVAQEREAVAVMRKQVEVTQNEQKFVQEVQPDLNNIGYLQATIQQAEQDLQQNLSNMTSEEMFKKKIEVDGFKEQLNALTEGLNAKYKEFEEAQKQSYEELLNEGAQVLKKAIPDWSEDKQKEVRDFAIAQGFTEQEVSSIIDPRHVKILWAASQYEALKGKAKPVSKKDTQPAIKPKARNPMPQDKRQKLDLRNKLKSKKLTARDKQKAVEDYFGERFG